MTTGDSAASLVPGFRFHPTDDELVSYYLKRKVSGKPFRFDAISDVDVYKSEPWDLPDKSRLKSRDLEWYFFSALDKKYGNGSRTNRATDKGYWKTTGKDRPVRRGSRTVGMKKTLVYHCGRAPRGERTNWVMHEYKLADEELQNAGVPQDAFVVCRIFQKSGSGPKNGEQYGAPFVEQEWDDDNVALVPGAVPVAELPPADDAYVEYGDLNQDLEMGVAENTSPPLNVCYGDSGNNVDESQQLIQNDENPFIGGGGNYLAAELPDDQKPFDFPAYDNNANTANNDYFVELTDGMNPEDANYLLDEPYLDATNNLAEDSKPVNNEYIGEQSNPLDPSNFFNESYWDAADNLLFDDGLFLEANDLSNPVEADSSGADLLEEYLVYLNAEEGSSDSVALDSSVMMGTENGVTAQDSSKKELVDAQTEQVLLGSQNNDAASSSSQNLEAEGLNTDIKSSFMRKAHCMLGSIPASPAYASELPSKDVIRRLNSAAQSSSSVRVTAGMIQISELTSGMRINWSFDKNGNLNLLLSFVLPQVGPDLFNMEPTASFLSAKMATTMPWACFYIIFFLALLLSVCYKFCTCICSR